MATLDAKRPHVEGPAEAADGIARSDARATNTQAHRALYQKREQIYPKAVHGPFRTLKWAAMALLLALYYLVPFLTWDRPGATPDQLVLVDFGARRMYFGPIEIWPQEVYYITGLLILGAVGLFLATALFGRVWCGYACPQTVWTDLYIAVEQLFEGDRNQRIRRDKAKMSFDKLWRKGAKHAVWILIAFATGGWFVAYFHDVHDLVPGFFVGTAPLSAYGFAGMLAFTTYMLAGTRCASRCAPTCAPGRASRAPCWTRRR
jgi:cytochrome c oxidase accessory protein FixG